VRQVQARSRVDGAGNDRLTGQHAQVERSQPEEKDIDAVGEDPGLKSDAITTARPASIMARAFGYSVRLNANTDAGKRTG